MREQIVITVLMMTNTEMMHHHYATVVIVKKHRIISMIYNTRLWYLWHMLFRHDLHNVKEMTVGRNLDKVWQTVKMRRVILSWLFYKWKMTDAKLRKLFLNFQFTLHIVIRVRACDVTNCQATAYPILDQCKKATKGTKKVVFKEMKTSNNFSELHW